MNYYKLSDKVLLNLNNIDYIREINNNIPSEHRYTIVMASGNLFQINENEYLTLVKNLEYRNLVN